MDRLGSALMQLGCAWLILMVWIPRLIIENRTVLPSEASMLFWAPYLAAAVVSLTGLYRARRAGMTAIGERKCPDCGYNLRGSVPALAVDRIGPARCNECGARWPLVPPADPVAEG